MSSGTAPPLLRINKISGEDAIADPVAQRREHSSHRARPAQADQPPITLIFIHRSPSWYLYYSVKQARKFNPRADIVVLTDQPELRLKPYARVLPLSAYWSPADAFEKIYRHLSFNSRDFELFCFQRWFVLADYIRQHRPDRIVHLDSDVLVYQDLDADFPRFAACDLALVGFQGPFSLFLPRPALVGEFCAHITHLFTHEHEALARKYETWRAANPYTAVSDMHALHDFVARRQLRTADLAVPHDHAAYDNVVHEADGYVTQDGIKVLEWISDRPHARRLSDQALIRLNTLHCQGPSKARMLSFFRARDAGYYRDKISEKLRSLLRR